LDLALSTRRGDSDVAANVIELTADERSVWLLPGVGDPAQMDVLAPHWPAITRALLGCGRDLLVDVGRATTDRPLTELTDRADLLVVVVRPTLLAVDRARPLVSQLQRDVACGRGIAEVGVLCVGDAPYPPGEVARALEAPLFGVLPDDRVSADRIAQGEVPWRRPLLRAARGVARKLGGRVDPSVELAVATS
jgi:hypothetical protein